MLLRGRTTRWHRSCHDNVKSLPPGVLCDENGRALHGWQTLLLPYIEEEALYKQIDLKVRWNEPRNSPHFTNKIRTYQHPAAKVLWVDGYAASHYAGNVHVVGRERPLTIPDGFPDGTANTILAAEVAGNYRAWGYPMNWRDPMRGFNRTPDGFGSPLGSDTLILLGDGSVRKISDKVSPDVLKALSTPDGGEPVPDY